MTVQLQYVGSYLNYIVYMLYEPIMVHKLLQPKDTYPYDMVLNVWDASDEKEIQKNNFLLCEAHIVQAELHYAIYEKESV